MTAKVIAQPPPPTIAWDAPSACPSQPAASHALQAMVGERLARGAQGSPLAQVTLADTGSHYTANIRFSGAPNGTRELRSEDCNTLAEAALLVVAITVAPAGVTNVIALPRSTRDDAEPGTEFEMSLRISGDLGSLPNPSLAPGVQVGLRFGALSVGVEAALWVPRRLNRTRDSGGLLGLGEAGLRSCFDLVRTSALQLGPCAAFALGLSQGSGRGLERPVERTQAPWSAARVGISLRHEQGPLFIELSVDAGLTIIRPEYTIDGETVFHPLWFGRTAIAIGWLL